MNAHTVHCDLPACRKMGTDKLGIVVAFDAGGLSIYHIPCPWCHGTFSALLNAVRIVSVQNQPYTPPR